VADLAGVLTITILLVVVIIFFPIPFSLKLAAIAVVWLANAFAWHRHRDAALSIPRAVRIAAFGALFLMVMAIADTGIGYLNGHRSVLDAFLNSGPFGGIADAVLALLGIFVGIPTLVRAVVLYYERRRT
jgi:hypothetical protein